MDTNSKSRRATVLLVAAFIIHNAEEAVFICRYPVADLVAFVKPLSCSQFKVAVLFITLAVLAAVIVAVRTKNQEIYLFVTSSLASALVLNAFVPHIALAIYTLLYTPGLISAILLMVPLGLLVLRINSRAYPNHKKMLLHAVSGLAIGYSIFILTTVLVKIFI